MADVESEAAETETPEAQDEVNLLSFGRRAWSLNCQSKTLRLNSMKLDLPEYTEEDALADVEYEAGTEASFAQESQTDFTESELPQDVAEDLTVESVHRCWSSPKVNDCRDAMLKLTIIHPEEDALADMFSQTDESSDESEDEL